MESGTLPFGLQVGAPRRTSNAMGAWERLAVAVLVATAACGLDKAGDVAESVDAWGAGVHAESGRVPALAVDASRDAKRAHDATVGAEAEGDAPHARDVSPERSVPPAETGADTGSDVTADSTVGFTVIVSLSTLIKLKMINCIIRTNAEIPIKKMKTFLDIASRKVARVIIQMFLISFPPHLPFELKK